MTSSTAASLLMKLERRACLVVKQATVEASIAENNREPASRAIAVIRSYNADLLTAANLGEEIERDCRLTSAVAEALDLYDTLCCAKASKLRQLDDVMVKLKQILAEGGAA